MSAVLSATGTLMSGLAQSQAASYQAHVATINSAISRQNSATALQEGQTAESASDLSTGEKIGAAKAGYAAGNVDVSGGTPLKTQSQIQTAGNLDALTIRYNARQKAYGYNLDAKGFADQSRLLHSQAVNAKWAGVIGAYNSYLGGSNASLNDFYALQAAGAAG